MLRKIIHIILTICILLSSVGFVVQKHYCQNELKHSSFLFKLDSCDKKKAKKDSCPMHTKDPSHQKDNSTSPEKDCCEDTVEVLKPEQDLQAKTSITQLEIDPLLLGFIAIVLKLILPENHKFSHPYQNYKPPLLVCDLISSLQTFLC